MPFPRLVSRQEAMPVQPSLQPQQLSETVKHKMSRINLYFMYYYYCYYYIVKSKVSCFSKSWISDSRGTFIASSGLESSQGQEPFALNRKAHPALHNASIELRVKETPLLSHWLLPPCWSWLWAVTVHGGMAMISITASNLL